MFADSLACDQVKLCLFLVNFTKQNNVSAKSEILRILLRDAFEVIKSIKWIFVLIRPEERIPCYNVTVQSTGMVENILWTR